MSGRIKKIEIQNFKSYKERQIIGPFKDFTAIIGPNGAGKSNLMDAISFGLGLSSKALRGSAMKDLISRSPNDTTQSIARRSAFVSVVFSISGEDNNNNNNKNNNKNDKNKKKQKLNDENDDEDDDDDKDDDDDNEDDEIKFTRTIKPDGSTNYKIDQTIVTFAEYEERLRKMNVLVKAKNFLVFQGEVEKIADMKPMDLTAMIEQVSGSIELQERYNQLAKEKDAAQENTIFNFHKKKGAAAEKKQYKEQSEEAQKYIKLQEEHGNLKVEHYLWELFLIESETINSRNEIVKLEEERKKNWEPKKTSAEGLLKTKKASLATVQKQIFNIDKKISDIDQKLQLSHPSKIQQKEEISHLNQRLSQQNSSKQKLQAEWDSYKVAISNLEQQEEIIATKINDYQASIDAAKRENKDLALLEEQLKDYSSLREKVTTATVNEVKDLEILQRSQRIQKEEIASLQNQLNTCANRRSQLEETIGKYKERLIQLQNGRNLVREKIANMQNEVNVTKQLKESNQRRYNELQDLIDGVNEQLQQAKAMNRESESSKRMNEALIKLKKIHPGVHGRLFDLCKPSKPKYNVPITVAMGSIMDAIVVESESIASDCIAYLRDNRIGTALFLPLDSIRTKPVNEKLRTLGGSIKLVYDVIQCEPSIQRAVIYAVGNTLICDTVEEARRLTFEGSTRYKIVTLDGTLFEKSGIMTGGISGVEAKAQRWDAKAIEALKRTRDSYFHEQSLLLTTKRNQPSLDELAQHIDGEQQTLNFLNEDINVTSRKISDNEKQIETLTTLVAKLQPQLNEKSIESNITESHIVELQQKINNIEDSIFKDFVVQVGVANIREFEQKQQHGILKEQNENMLALKKQEAVLLQEIQYRKGRDFQTPFNSIEEGIKTMTERLNKIKTEQEKSVGSDKKINEDKLTYTKERDQAKKNVTEIETEIGEIRQSLRDAEKNLEIIRKNVSGQESVLEQLRLKQMTLIMRCRVESVPLPIENTTGLADTILDVDEDDLKASQIISFPQNQSQSQSQLNNSNNNNNNNNNKGFQVLFDYSSLSDHLKTMKLDEKEKERIRTQYIERLKGISTELERMAPNMRAVDHLGDVKGRLSVLNVEFEEAKSVAKKATQAFLDTKNERVDKFMKAFSLISESIGKIYKELNNGSGSASLTLENSDQPFVGGIKYTAQPPQKRFREMDQLSGGERTVAALALLFAIHSFHPSPFFILDEVDAALDKENIANVARFIAKSSEKFQCIVISLKDNFYDKANGLIGIYREATLHSSKTLTLDLTPYSD